MLSEELLSQQTSVIGAGLAGLILVATIAGFCAGVWFAPWLQERAARRSARRVQRLTALVLGELERAARMGQFLGASTTSPLEPGHWQRLEQVRQQFGDLWQQLASRQSTPVSVAATVIEPRPVKAVLEWNRTPIEPLTHLPDKAAFDANLKQMLQTATVLGQTCGLMLIRMDKADQLIMRYGPTAAAALQERVADVIVQSARDSDLVCRVSADLFGVLMPGVSPLEGVRIAETFRAAVRDHSFRFEDDGPAVLVTASFGYAACLPTDPPNLVVDRAAEALDKSQSTGRNQLHLHDGTNRVLSHIG